jgi:hypothetical protein
MLCFIAAPTNAIGARSRQLPARYAQMPNASAVQPQYVSPTYEAATGWQPKPDEQRVVHDPSPPQNYQQPPPMAPTAAAQQQPLQATDYFAANTFEQPHNPMATYFQAYQQPHS